jgi:HJR/Mrr/RecB family endonuclease
VYVYTVGAVHPQLADSSYDIVLDNLLRSRREASKRIFTSSEITAADLIDAMTSADRDSGERLLREIDASDYLGLEEFVRDRLISEGLAVNMTRRTGDGGADIVVRDELGQIIYLVQCKHTLNVETPVDAGLLQDAQRVRGNWNAPDAIVVGVSNAKKFAPRVVEAFNFMGGRLISRDELCSMRLISAGSNLN